MTDEQAKTIADGIHKAGDCIGCGIVVAGMFMAGAIFLAGLLL